MNINDLSLVTPLEDQAAQVILGGGVEKATTFQTKIGEDDPAETGEAGGIQLPDIFFTTKPWYCFYNGCQE